MNKLLFLPPVIFLLIFAWERIDPARAGGSGGPRHVISNLSIALMGGLLQFLFLSIVAPGAVQWASDHSSGFLHRVSLPFWPQLVAAFLLQDLWMYAWHRANHKVGLLWRFHRAHHNDVQLDATTALRFHPAEIMISMVFSAALILLVGASLDHLIAYNVIFLGVIFFHHSNTAFPENWDRIFRFLIVTPHLHRVHHSIDARQTNTNYGSVFSFWDRLFLTLATCRDTRLVVFGLKTFRDASWQDPWGILRIPFVSAV